MGTWEGEGISNAYQRNMRKSISEKDYVFVLDIWVCSFVGNLKQGRHLNWERDIINVESLGNSDKNYLKRTKKNCLIWKDPDAGAIEGRRRRRWDGGWDGWMPSPTQWTWVWVNSGSWWWTGLACCSPCGRKESDMTEWLNWTELNKK